MQREQAQHVAFCRMTRWHEFSAGNIYHLICLFHLRVGGATLLTILILLRVWRASRMSYSSAKDFGKARMTSIVSVWNGLAGEKIGCRDP